MKTLLYGFACFIFALNAFALTDAEKADILLSEYKSFRQAVSTMEPDYKIGDFHSVKKFDGYVLVWALEEEKDRHEVIRIYRDKGEYKGFAVTYHRSSIIAEGRIVIRRFIGPEPYGWRNDTIDMDTLEYLGSQGMREPRLDKNELKILKKWNITQFND